MVALLTREVQRSTARVLGFVDAGAGAEEELDALDAAEEAARVERRAAVVARQVDVGARADEVRDARDVPLLARDVERARAVAARPGRGQAQGPRYNNEIYRDYS